MARVEPSHAVSGVNSRAANSLVRAMSVANCANYPNCLYLDDELSELFALDAANSSSQVVVIAHSWVAVLWFLIQVVAKRCVVIPSERHARWTPVQLQVPDMRAKMAVSWSQIAGSEEMRRQECLHAQDRA
jgi:hypothetical protein